MEAGTATTQAAAPTAPKKQRITDRAKAERKLAWMLCAPAVVAMLVVTGYPIGYAFYLSLQRYDLRFPDEKEFVGFANYGDVLTSTTWWSDVWTTLIITVSSVAALEEAHLAYSDVGSFYDHGSGDALVALSRRAWRARGLGDFWMHVLVAEGAFDVAVEPVVSLWDLAAVQVIVEEAGGRFTSLDGVAQADAGSACSTNGLLHEDVLAVFAR